MNECEREVRARLAVLPRAPSADPCAGRRELVPAAPFWAVLSNLIKNCGTLTANCPTHRQAGL
jgi:hypothetical protein